MALRLYAGFLALALVAALTTFGCDSKRHETIPAAELVNFAHLERLAEDIVVSGDTLRIIHIYSEHPDYEWVGDEDEGIACVDDAARAAVLYLRRYELTGAADARRTAEKLIRFLFEMQTETGLFHNFVWDNKLDKNVDHVNSRADQLNWWTARATWALGRCAEVLKDDQIASECVIRARKVIPHIEKLLTRYGETTVIDGRRYPTWLMYEYAADATSELLLGLIALQAADSKPGVESMVHLLAEGLEMMQGGSLSRSPYGAHLSWRGTWHAWGNSQTQALASAGMISSAQLEAEHFYPWLLVNGWASEIHLDAESDIQTFPQIAYGVRCVVSGLAALYDHTQDEKWAILAGLAASWFTGNNPVGKPMYDPETGRGFDGINGPDEINQNAGAESTVEALLSIQEAERIDAARKWLGATGGPTKGAQIEGKQYSYRLFSLQDPDAKEELAIVLDLTNDNVEILSGSELRVFLENR